MVVTGALSYVPLNLNSPFAPQSQTSVNSPLAPQSQTSVTYSSPLNCPKGTYQGEYNGQQKCLYAPGAPKAGQPAAGYFGPAATDTSVSGCFGCVFITSLTVVNYNGYPGGYGSNPVPNVCAPRGYTYSASQLAGFGMGPLTADGQAIEVVGPGQNGQSARSFSYWFNAILAYGVQSDGTDCSMGVNYDSISLSNEPNGIVLQSTTPSMPYDVVNIGDSGGSQRFAVQFYSLDGNYYYGGLTLIIYVSSDK
jgi:hypothetical protein